MAEASHPKPEPSPAAGPVQSAARPEPVKPLPAAAPAPVADALKAQALEAALNLRGMARDGLADFQRRDRFFKLKCLIVAAWAVLSATGVGVACSDGSGPSNDIAARLLTSQVLDTPVFMIVNDSGRTWEDVTVEVNGTWRASVARIPHEAPANTLTLDPKRLLGEGGQSAPNTLQMTDIRVRTSRGEARLMERGRILK